MQRGKFTKLFEEDLFVENLAREFYALLGYGAPLNSPDDFPASYMRDSVHPTERTCYAMAIHAANSMMRHCVKTIDVESILKDS